MIESTRQTGSKGENIVCERLVDRGMEIISRNVREKFGEIDIVAMENDTIVFVEVRTRQNADRGHPAETVTPAKQRVIRRTAEAYLAKNNILDTAVRFDVATILWDSLEFDYFENAF